MGQPNRDDLTIRPSHLKICEKKNSFYSLHNASTNISQYECSAMTIIVTLQDIKCEVCEISIPLKMPEKFQNKLERLTSTERK